MPTPCECSRFPLETDPLMWWKQLVQEFPCLVRMVRQCLTVSATSVSPERLYSCGMRLHIHSSMRTHMSSTLTACSISSTPTSFLRISFLRIHTHTHTHIHV